MYQKEYEDFFRSEDMQRVCDVGKILPSADEYARLMREEIRLWHAWLFDRIMRAAWLFRRFSYDGKPRTNFSHNDSHLDSAFGVFMRNFVGYSQQIITTSEFNRAIVSYIEEFFPGMYEMKLEDQTFPFPFTFMTLDCLVFVYRMPERMELLRQGEEKKMMLAEFMDYVINHIMCYNEEFGLTYTFDKDVSPFTIKICRLNQ